VVRELAGVRCLTGALQADEHDNRRRLPGKLNLAFGVVLAAEHLDELLMDDANDLLGPREALEHLGANSTLLHAGDRLPDHLEVAIVSDQWRRLLAHSMGPRLHGALAFPREPVENPTERLGKTFEHSNPPPSQE